MSENTTDRQKRIVQKLEFDARTAKRVRWTEWEFSIKAPHQVCVTNASYGAEKSDHVYSVTIAEDEDDADLFVPLHCDCPADHYQEDDCKHKVAIAVCGGPVLVGAAMAYATDGDEVPSRASRVMTDGGQQFVSEGRDRDIEPERAQERAAYVHALSADQTARADALGLSCPDWCDGPMSEDLCCFRCHFINREASKEDTVGQEHDQRP